MIHEFSGFKQKISSLSENLEKTVNDMKIQNKNVNLLHGNNIESFSKMRLPKIIKSLNLWWKFKRHFFILYRQKEVTQLSQICIINNCSNKLNCWRGEGGWGGQPTAERLPCIGFRVCSWVQILDFGKWLTRTFICG